MMSFVLLLLSGCPEDGGECNESTACPFGSVCEDGVCVEQSCSTSDQCGIEQYCADRSCTEGCQLDTDCKFGDVCDPSALLCISAECSDTRLHCSFGEFCSPAGECYEAGGYYCEECEDDGDCGGGGNYCLSGTCGVECETDADCPAGFDCYPIGDFNGNTIGHNCWTNCNYDPATP